jgi:serine protease AprX
MKRFTASLFLSVILFTTIAILPADSGYAVQTAPWYTRVDPSILEAATSNGTAEFLVQMKAQADLNPAARLKTKTEKGAFVFNALHELADQSQQPLLKYLQQRGISYRSHWVVNVIWVHGDLAAIQWLAERPEVAQLLGNPAMRVSLPESTPLLEGIPSPEAQLAPDASSCPTLPWNLDKVRADEVWALGYTGQDVVIGGADTGYKWDHPALKNQYRGWDGSTADHNYNWYDAFNTTDGETCTFFYETPVDSNGHGTHTMGIMVGEVITDTGVLHIGMAPGAKWIGCRNMQGVVGTPDSYIQCFEFFIAPTDTHCQNPDTTKAPDVINNSWACLTSEGCTVELINILRDAVEAVRAAGILTVQSAGNYGPSCESVETPAAIYDASFSVANTNSLDQVVSNSSRGPVTIDGSGRLKPDIAAPGQNICSSYLNDLYVSLGGTSMSAPHVVGLAALLISAKPELAGQVDLLEQYIRDSAVPVTDPYNPGCGGIPITTYPNNSAGWGRIDALASVVDALLYKLYFPLVPVDVKESQ